MGLIGNKKDIKGRRQKLENQIKKKKKSRPNLFLLEHF
jgi:hypothetical protein